MKGCRPFTDEEVEQIYRYGFTGRFAGRNRAMFAVGINTGFRIAELLSLRVGDVWKNKVVLRHVYVPRRYMKNRKSGRTKPIYENTRTALREWIKEMNQLYEISPKTYLFVSREGGNRAIDETRAHSIIKEATERVGIVEPNHMIGTHSMRKTYARRIYSYFDDRYRNGIANENPLIATMYALGHASVENTKKYISFIFEEAPAEVTDVF